MHSHQAVAALAVLQQIDWIEVYCNAPVMPDTTRSIFPEVLVSSSPLSSVSLRAFRPTVSIWVTPISEGGAA